MPRKKLAPILPDDPTLVLANRYRALAIVRVQGVGQALAPSFAPLGAHYKEAGRTAAAAIQRKAGGVGAAMMLSEDAVAKHPAYKRLLREVGAASREPYRAAFRHVRGAVDDIIPFARDYARAQLDLAHLRAGLTAPAVVKGVPTLRQLRAVVNKEVNVRALRASMQDAYRDQTRAAGRALVEGLRVGNTPYQIGDAMAQASRRGFRRVLTTIDTEQSRANRAVQRAIWKASGTVDRYVRRSQLDARTCVACLALDGTVYRVEVDIATHPGCRCTLVPVLVGQQAENDKRGEVWLRSQPVEVQQGVMGHARAAAWSPQRGLNSFISVRNDATYGPTVALRPLR